QKRPEMVLEVAAEETENAAGLPVEAPPEAEHLVLACGGLREPQGGFHRFGAPGEQLDARQPLRRQRGQSLQEPRTRLRGEASERQPLDLTLERLDVVGVAVADAADSDAGDEVDVLVAVLVDELAAFAAGD